MDKHVFSFNNLLLLSYWLLVISFFLPDNFIGAAFILCGVISLTQIKKLPLKKITQFPLNLFPPSCDYLSVNPFYAGYAFRCTSRQTVRLSDQAPHCGA